MTIGGGLTLQTLYNLYRLLFMASVLVSAGLCEFSLVKHANLMRMSHRRQAMCNNLGFTKGDSPTSIRSIQDTLRAPNLFLSSFMIFLKYAVLHCPAPLCVFDFARLEQAVAHEKPVWAHMAWDLSIVHTLLYYIGLYYIALYYTVLQYAIYIYRFLFFLIVEMSCYGCSSSQLQQLVQSFLHLSFRGWIKSTGCLLQRKVPCPTFWEWLPSGEHTKSYWKWP